MPVGVQLSHLLLTRWVSQLLGLVLVSWDFAHIGVHRPSFRLPYLVSSIRRDLPLDFNRVSSLRPTYRHPFGRPSLSHFLDELRKAWDWLWYPMLWFQRRDRGFLSGLSPIAKSSPEVTHWSLGPGLLAGGLYSPSRHTVEGYLQGLMRVADTGGATHQPPASC